MLLKEVEPIQLALWLMKHRYTIKKDSYNVAIGIYNHKNNYLATFSMQVSTLAVVVVCGRRQKT